MPHQIIIDGNLVRIVNMSIEAEVPLTELTEFLVKSNPTILPTLPDHTRFVAFDPNTKRGIILVGLPPTRSYMTMRYDPNDHRGVPIDVERRDPKTGLAAFFLQFPYLYFYYGFQMEVRYDAGYDRPEVMNFRLDEASLYWSPEAFADIKSKLYPAQLPNVSGAKICWGDTRADTKSLSRRIDSQVNSFWTTHFNTHYHQPAPNGYKSYTEWENASEDPAVFRKWSDWKAGAFTLETVVNQIEALSANMEDSTNEIKPPPDRFTIGRALQWMNEIPDSERRLFLAALKKTVDETPELISVKARPSRNTALLRETPPDPNAEGIPW